MCAWLLSPAGPPLARARIWGVAWPLAGLVLTAVGDIHGPPLLLGFALGARLLWRDRKGCPGAPRSRRDRGAGTLLTGFALAALAGVHADGMPRLRSPD